MLMLSLSLMCPHDAMAQEMPRGCGVRARRLDSDLELESRRSMDLGEPAALKRSFLKHTYG